ncbi:exported hypothetical protein [Paraburkholderia piptadeniae]|uniref:Uncharacterized protein n=1 Tax=Paraburkholderia piptadeniae TaxID=1701573 RepID=A0A1N7SBB8_9BURK|nr:hypothetical protein [Paraburkholderia piptadeniae]SIT44623.1 exported hypothetical protein [Paraburkholderia piptadeniae]
MSATLVGLVWFGLLSVPLASAIAPRGAGVAPVRGAIADASVRAKKTKAYADASGKLSKHKQKRPAPKQSQASSLQKNAGQQQPANQFPM